MPPKKQYPARTSPRAPWWNYGWDGAYFITIITHERLMLFGDVVNGQMVPSAVGRIAIQCWNDIVKHARNIELGELVVMPNHIHNTDYTGTPCHHPPPISQSGAQHDIVHRWIV